MKPSTRILLDWINIPIDTYRAFKYTQKKALQIHHLIRLNYLEWRLNSFPIRFHMWILKLKVEL